MLPSTSMRVRDGDVAVEQVADRLRDDRLAVAGRAVDEHRVAAVDRRAELIEHALAEHQVRRTPRARASRVASRGVAARRTSACTRSYCASGTGATPTYWFCLEEQHGARVRPASVMR